MNPQTISPAAAPASSDRAGTAPRAYLNLIGGQWVPARSGKTTENRNPDRKSVV